MGEGEVESGGESVRVCVGGECECGMQVGE